MAKMSNIYDITMPLTSKALYLKDVLEFAIHNGTKYISPAVTLEGSIAIFLFLFYKNCNLIFMK